MKILMVGTKIGPMVSELKNILNSKSVDLYIGHDNRFILRDGSEIQIVKIEKMHDVEKLSGLRFDLILEHHSFPPDYAIFNAIKAQVQR